MKKKAPVDFIFCNTLCFYVVFLCITPEQWQAFPLVVWLGMIVLNVLTVRFFLLRASYVKPTTKTDGYLKKSSEMALLSSFLFMLICLSFKTKNHTIIIVAFAIIAINATSVIFTIVSHIKSIDNKKKSVLQNFKIGIKYSWLIVTIISYYLARSFISNLFDIPFGDTFYKLMPFTFSMLFTFLFYCLIYILFNYFLVFVNPETKKFKGGSSAYQKHTLIIFVPLIAIGFFSYIAVYMQAVSIFRFCYEFSLKYDTRDTFFCHDKYMFLWKHPDARFWYVSSESYRVLIPHGKDFSVLRLTCKNSEPFYSLVEVNDKDSLIVADLEKRVKELTNDLKTATDRHTP